MPLLSSFIVLNPREFGWISLISIICSEKIPEVAYFFINKLFIEFIFWRDYVGLQTF